MTTGKLILIIVTEIYSQKLSKRFTFCRISVKCQKYLPVPLKMKKIKLSSERKVCRKKPGLC